MAGLCRLCAESRSLEKMYEINDTNLNIEQKLVDCCRWTYIKELNADMNLPQQICIVCIEKLEQCWSFAESVANAQYKLIEFIDSTNLVSFDLLNSVDENIQKFDDQTMNDYNYNGNTEDSQINSMQYQANECVAASGEFDLVGKAVTNIQRNKNHVNNEFDVASSSQANIDGNDGDQNAEDEKSFHPSNFVKNFLRLVDSDDRNVDGTIKTDAIQRLRLVNWMVLQHQCWVCYVCFCSNYELKTHVISEHSKDDLRYMCSMCKQKNSRTYRRSSTLHKHIIRKHLAHLKYW